MGLPASLRFIVPSSSVSYTGGVPKAVTTSSTLSFMVVSSADSNAAKSTYSPNNAVTAVFALSPAAMALPTSAYSPDGGTYSNSGVSGSSAMPGLPKLVCMLVIAVSYKLLSAVYSVSKVP